MNDMWTEEQEPQQAERFPRPVDELAEKGDPDGCSPWACRSGAPVAADDAA